MEEMTQAQRDIVNAALARVRAEEQQRQEVPTQRLRTAAQGLSFGFGDEIEARARSLATGRPYQEILDEIRGGLKAYSEARPIESTVFEIGGSIIPAMASGGSSLLRAGGRAALEGATMAFGTGEGGFMDRASRVLGGGLLGAAGGVTGKVAGDVIGGAANRLIDTARRTVGNRGSTIVENEIQRLVSATGRTPDQITQDIIDGRLLAENKTIQAAVRALRVQGGDASRIIQEGLEHRPTITREQAMANLNQYLGSVGDSSQAALTRASDEATRAQVRSAYSQFEGVDAPQAVSDGVKVAVQKVPQAITEVNKMFRGLVRTTPPKSGIGSDNVTFTRPITIDEAERIRRAVKNAASSEFRAGFGGAGRAFSDVEKSLRGLLDEGVPKLADTRAFTAGVKANRKAYKAGQLALVGDINEKLADFAKLSQGAGGPEAVEAFRAGLMQALEARAATGSRQSMMRNFLDPTQKEGQLLREVFPQDQLDDVLQKIDIAVDAQNAANKLLIGTGSQTTESSLEVARQGAGISLNELSGVMSGSAVETLSVANKLLQRLVRTKLSDAERARIAEILVSSDPAIVRNAIKDESGMQRFADAAAQVAFGLQNVTRGASAMQSGEAGGELTGPVTRGLLAQ